MDYIKTITEQGLCELIENTQESLFICMPLLQPSIVKSVKKLENSQSIKKIYIGLDFTSETFRQGYGEIDAFTEYKFGNNVSFKSLPDNRITFIISDDIGYYLFIESRYFIPADKETINAIEIDKVSITRIKSFFFEIFNSEEEFLSEIANSIIDESKRMDELKESLDSNIYLYSHPIDESLLDNIVSDLQKNPPLKPDYKRLVNVYTNKLQYVKLKINGLNVDDSKVKLPKDTLPIRNKELIKKIESKLSLFTEKDKDEYFQELKKYKDEISEIRKKHLTPLKTRDESILHLDKKLLFNDEINNVVDKYKKHVKDSVHLLQNKITNTKTNLLSVLTEFFMLNKEELIDKDSLFKNNIEYLDYLAKTKAEDIVHKIKWPNAHELIKKLEVNIMYSDITFEDLKNKNLLNELVEKEIIDKSDFNELAEFSQAIVLENND